MLMRFQPPVAAVTKPTIKIEPQKAALSVKVEPVQCNIKAPMAPPSNDKRPSAPYSHSLKEESKDTTPSQVTQTRKLK
jgi:hypothetical protein